MAGGRILPVRRGGWLLVPVALAGLAACAPPTREQVLEYCLERAQAAAGPSGRITLGHNSNNGPFAETELSVSGDYLAGRDPQQVYRQCVLTRLGTMPATPPVIE